MGRYRPVDPKVDFPAMERRILEFWRSDSVFERSLEQRRGAPEWVFYDGPPTANGRPHIGHVEARTFKDVYPRFRAMAGHSVHRKAGWDCHGLPVELEVEKAIGTSTKRDIEAFGIAEFNRLCRESVVRYVDDWRRLSERIGHWIDMQDPYWTMSDEYVESVWWSLKTLFERGLLFEADRVSAYCPRCGTPLSDHEVSQGYAQVEDPSVFVRMPLVSSPERDLVGASLVAWTTTPWTLVSNTGIAVAPDAEYALVEAGGNRLVMAESRREAVLEGTGSVLRRFPGSALQGSRYDPPYPNVTGAHAVVTAGFVETNEGSGIVHMAPAFGAEDMAIGQTQGWPVFKPVDDEGKFTDLAPAFVRGTFVKDADAALVEDLTARGLMVRSERIVHTYPLCWRCKTPLLYYARTSWYVRTTAVKDRLLEVNESVDWHPEHIRHGRFGDWLANNVDWALSRDRYWGTPLPLWRCGAGHVTAVGSRSELSELAGTDVTGIDPHRPAIDEVTFRCPQCREQARRVPQVIDAWYDSGAMPFAQWGFHPDLDRGQEEFARRFPADFIAEGLDQTRGWFYSLMAEGVLLFDSTAYRTVICHGLVVDREGRKMSKSVGNVLDPWGVIDRYGADAIRWFFVTGGSPWVDRRVYPEVLEDVVRQFLLTLWNVYAFHVTYANADDFDPGAQAVRPADRPPLDRWILSRLAQTVTRAREGLEAFDATDAGRGIAHFVDDLSNWYVRRARRRFWDPARTGAGAADKAAASLTLHECLITTARLLAPFTPFVAEELWRNLAAGRDGEADSVHLTDYPQPEPSAVDQDLERAMQAAREIVSLGRQARTETKTRVRQPLARALVHLPGGREPLEPLLDLVAEELNVKRVEFVESTGELGGWRARPNFKALGPRLGSGVKEVAAALSRDDGSLAAELAAGRAVRLPVGGDEVELSPQDVEVVREVREGWGAVAEAGVTVALDLDVTPELRREGLARELVRMVQDARKAAGLDVTDRIVLGVQAEGELARALDEHAAYVSGETLAVERVPSVGAGGAVIEGAVDGSPVRISVTRVDRP